MHHYLLDGLNDIHYINKIGSQDIITKQGDYVLCVAENVDAEEIANLLNQGKALISELEKLQEYNDDHEELINFMESTKQCRTISKVIETLENYIEIEESVNELRVANACCKENIATLLATNLTNEQVDLVNAIAENLKRANADEFDVIEHKKLKKTKRKNGK